MEVRLAIDDRLVGVVKRPGVFGEATWAASTFGP